MRRRVAIALAASLALVVLAAPSSAGALNVSDRDALEASIVTRINAVRKSYGLRPLTVVSRLATAADRHATSMGAASYFRHELYTPTRAASWTSFGTWIRWYWPGPGYSSWSAGENLAWGAPSISASQTVSRWLASPGHRANLLNRAWRNIGVGAVHVTDPHGYYGSWDDVTIVAAEFGARR
ncbi:MAG TPA: CAP domain-containing protein [Gaiellaceae bacterium]|nr:CAP domain-containing protein [Gaiellaceae bacterium]